MKSLYDIYESNLQVVTGDNEEVDWKASILATAKQWAIEFLFVTATSVGTALVTTAINKIGDIQKKRLRKKIVKVIKDDVKTISLIFKDVESKYGHDKVVEIQDRLEEYMIDRHTTLYSDATTHERGPRYKDTQIEFLISLFPQEYSRKLKNVVNSMNRHLENAGINTGDTNFVQAFI